MDKKVGSTCFFPGIASSSRLDRPRRPWSETSFSWSLRHTLELGRAGSFAG